MKNWKKNKKNILIPVLLWGGVFSQVVTISGMIALTVQTSNRNSTSNSSESILNFKGSKKIKIISSPTSANKNAGSVKVIDYRPKINTYLEYKNDDKFLKVPINGIIKNLKPNEYKLRWVETKDGKTETKTINSFRIEEKVPRPIIDINTLLTNNIDGKTTLNASNLKLDKGIKYQVKYKSNKSKNFLAYSNQEISNNDEFKIILSSDKKIMGPEESKEITYSYTVNNLKKLVLDDFLKTYKMSFIKKIDNKYKLNLNFPVMPGTHQNIYIKKINTQKFIKMNLNSEVSSGDIVKIEYIPGEKQVFKNKQTKYTISDSSNTAKPFTAHQMNLADNLFSLTKILDNAYRRSPVPNEIAVPAHSSATNYNFVKVLENMQNSSIIKLDKSKRQDFNWNINNFARLLSLVVPNMSEKMPDYLKYTKKEASVLWFSSKLNAIFVSSDEKQKLKDWSERFVYNRKLQLKGKDYKEESNLLSEFVNTFKEKAIKTFVKLLQFNHKMYKMKYDLHNVSKIIKMGNINMKNSELNEKLFLRQPTITTVNMKDTFHMQKAFQIKNTLSRDVSLPKGWYVDTPKLDKSGLAKNNVANFSIIINKKAQGEISITGMLPGNAEVTVYNGGLSSKGEEMIYVGAALTKNSEPTFVKKKLLKNLTVGLNTINGIKFQIPPNTQLNTIKEKAIALASLTDINKTSILDAYGKTIILFRENTITNAITQDTPAPVGTSFWSVLNGQKTYNYFGDTTVKEWDGTWADGQNGNPKKTRNFSDSKFIDSIYEQLEQKLITKYTKFL